MIETKSKEMCHDFVERYIDIIKNQIEKTKKERIEYGLLLEKKENKENLTECVGNKYCIDLKPKIHIENPDLRMSFHTHLFPSPPSIKDIDASYNNDENAFCIGFPLKEKKYGISCFVIDKKEMEEIRNKTREQIEKVKKLEIKFKNETSESKKMRMKREIIMNKGKLKKLLKTTPKTEMCY